MNEIKSVDISPTEFELQVKDWLSKTDDKLTDFKVEHSKQLEGRSGEYEIDAVAYFSIFNGAEIKVLVECKRYKNPVKRDVVMLLNQKLIEIGAHKGMIFSTSGYQSGAIEFANEHGIATVTVQDGRTNYHTKSTTKNIEPPPWVDTSKFIGWFTDLSPNNNIQRSLIDDDRILPINKWLRDEEET